ncbi:hypothetical protein E4U43_000954 [Claviceps pusilla]|uniref:BCAS3 domain-containing protein n=1 Tax=Claviceps pusilla TaxID=123648 RepID=A0A9P7NB10_9HYPO|nr:hypothetical protein E4U43_000954 [Claviceps pusilla]
MNSQGDGDRGRDDGNKTHDGNSATSNKSPTPSEASSPPVNTPEIRPSFVDHGPHVAESPLLDALSATSASPNTVPSLTNEWAKTIMAGSPNNLINLTSESPPTQPSSFEDAAKMHNGWAAHRPFTSPSPASLSPPSSNRRPLSFQSDTQYHMAGTSPRSHSAANRRASVYSHFSTSQAAGPHHHPQQHQHQHHPPPLPHHPQSHFYGVRDLDLDLTSTGQSGMKAGDQGYYFGFDRLPSDNGPPAKAEKVVLAGYQGGLHVYAVGRKGTELVGSLKGLRGGVHHAKILPWTLNSQCPDIFPLVAVVVHGPVLPSRSTDVGGGRPDAASSPDPTPDSSASSRPSHAPHSEAYPTRAAPPIQFYQTSVEMYSLRTNKLVDVLLQAPKQAINTGVSLSSPLFQPPSPSGALSVKADAGTVAICSGLTGECWMYRQLCEPQNAHMFACVGKVWTTIQQSYRAEVLEEADKTSTFSSSARAASHQMPIFSLNGRWIAYCPSNPSSQAALRAHIPVPTQGRAPGVSSMAPPHLPLPSVTVDLPISDSMMNKFMRETTQELISGMKWVGQQGLQAWNSYWGQPLTSPTQQQQQQQQQQTRSPPSHWNVASSSPSSSARAPPSVVDPTSQFPPTHGTSGPIASSTAKDPGLVSIVDVEMLPVSTTVHSLATFATPLGCSFVSFSPSSLALFTASSKGDVQTVWDLFRLQHTSSSPLQTTLTQYETIGPQVRQIAQFSRMTVARIVDVAWSEPLGDRLAMVTERGTIHLLDMPFSSFMWPPPRRRKVANTSSGVESAEHASSAVSIASGALGAAYQAAKPFVSRSRRGSSNNAMNTTTVSPIFAGSALRDSAAQGGRVIAASISHSLGKTGTAISQLRHTRDNRVSLPPSVVVPSVSCVSWFRGRRSQSLFAVGGGMVRAFPCRTRASTSTSISTSSSSAAVAAAAAASVIPGKQISRANKYKDFKVPLLPDDAVAPIVRHIMEFGAAEEYLELSDADMDAENTLTLKPPRVSETKLFRPVLDATIPQAEIESSAPYQPFHTDRRVTLCEYGREDSASVLLANTNIEEAESLTSEEKKKKKKQNNNDKKKTKTTKYKDSRQVAESGLSAWAFGQPIPAVHLDLGSFSNDEDFVGPDDHMALPQSAMERVMQYGDAEQIVVTTRRRRGGHQGDGDEDGFFEDDCEVLDFADQRV